MIRGGEYDGDLLLGLLLGVLLLVLDESLLVQACKCSEPLVEALVLALELLLGVDVLFVVESFLDELLTVCLLFPLTTQIQTFLFLP